MAPQRLLIDTDPGQDIDDLLALHFALLRPELDIRAITTVTAPAAGRARLVRRLLRHLGRDGVPVAAGMELPLRDLDPAELAAQDDLARTMNHRCFAEPEDGRDAPADHDAAGLIIRTVEAHPGAVGIAAIAPLTNLATALRRRPSIAAQIPFVALMGGEVAQLRSEHNIASDPVAAQIVLSSGIPIRMGTWSVTRQVTLDDADCRRFADDARPLHRALAAAIAAWRPAQPWKPGPVMYDLFPLVWAFAPALYRLEAMRVSVAAGPGPAAGMTIPGAGHPLEATTAVDAAAVKRLYLETVFA
ncbi:MAG: nucleoside hydrolase [Planctomycetes bacterium]|nr:nucleoside hydrolase [Planctomycetota bacterium]